MYDSEKPANAIKAVELSDKCAVTKIVGMPSGRFFYLVQGQSGSGRKSGPYLCMGDYCTCHVTSAMTKRRQLKMC